MSKTVSLARRSRRNLIIGGTLVLLGLAAAWTVPKLVEHHYQSKAKEAGLMLLKLEGSSKGYAESALANRAGGQLFPKSAPLTPATGACKDGELVPHVPTPAMWAHPTWRALNFSIDAPFLYQYAYLSDGKSFTARAVGDLDCDGVLSMFERVGLIDDNAVFKAGAGLYMLKPLE